MPPEELVEIALRVFRSVASARRQLGLIQDLREDAAEGVGVHASTGVIFNSGSL